MSATAEVMATVPCGQRERIVSGMRWTVALSAAAAPLGYATTILLGRLGPEVLGTYGLLMVYMGMVTSLLYLGGDAVSINFLPKLPLERRAVFLWSYFLVICASLLPWVGVGALCPGVLWHILGRQGEGWISLLVLALTPMCIGSMMVTAALKAALDIRGAQILSRVVSIGSYFAYGILYLWFRPLLRANCMLLVWGVYFALTDVVLLLGLKRLASNEDWRLTAAIPRFFLPAGFWRYTLAIQQVSALGFFQNRLDLILVLNLAGLEALGKYVAMLTLAALISSVSRLLLDVLLPALTNLLTATKTAAAEEVFTVNLRLLFAASAGAGCCLMFLVEPVMDLLGRQYAAERVGFVLMILCYALSAPGLAGGTLLTSLGKQQRSVWVGLGQLGLFLVLFAMLWPPFRLLGAAAASGLSMSVGQVVLLITARQTAKMGFSIWREYVSLVVVGCTGAFTAVRLSGLGVAGGVVAGIIAVSAFLMFAGYRCGELLGFATCLVPGWHWLRVRSQQHA